MQTLPKFPRNWSTDFKIFVEFVKKNSWTAFIFSNYDPCGLSKGATRRI